MRNLDLSLYPSFKTEFGGLLCHEILNGKEKYLKMDIMDKTEVNPNNLFPVLGKKNYKEVEISNIYSVKVLKDIIFSFENYDFDCLITLNLCSSDVSSENIIRKIDGLNNNVHIDLECIPSYMKISAFPEDNSQTEFTTWAHNLHKKDRDKLLKVLTDIDKELFLKQEKVIVNFYRKMTRKYADLNEMSDYDKFNVIFDYFLKKYPAIGTEENFANLLTLVTNNHLIKLNCCTVYGKKDEINHIWNQFMYENKIINYDLSCDIKDASSIKMKNSNYVFERVYPCTLENKKSRGETSKRSSSMKVVLTPITTQTDN